MRCYHCLTVGRKPYALNYILGEAVGVCHQCGEAVCQQHAVKSDLPLPGELANGTRPATGRPGERRSHTMISPPRGQPSIWPSS